MGGFFGKTFLPAMKKLVKSDLSYDEVKKLVKLPTPRGAKITGEGFQAKAPEAPRDAKKRRPAQDGGQLAIETRASDGADCKDSR